MQIEEGLIRVLRVICGSGFLVAARPRPVPPQPIAKRWSLPHNHHRKRGAESTTKPPAMPPDDSPASQWMKSSVLLALCVLFFIYFPISAAGPAVNEEDLRPGLLATYRD